MTNFNSQVGGGVYRVQMVTDNKEAYVRVQEVIREFIDLENVQEVDVSKMENPTLAEECSVCGVCPENTEVQEDDRPGKAGGYDHDLRRLCTLRGMLEKQASYHVQPEKRSVLQSF